MISAVSDWLKLLALIIVVADGLLAVAYYSTKDSDPFRKYYFPLMIGLFALIVVGVFLDRVLSSRAPHSQTSAPGGVRPRQVALVTRWYFKSGITEEELDLTIVGNTVTGERTTRHPKGKETHYAVTGWHHTSTFWLEYHDIMDQYGGGSILLDEFTNDRLSGMVLSKDCNTGTMQCRANIWLPSKLKKDHKEEFFRFIGAIDRAELLNQVRLAS